jgi:hypothetical protein
MKHLGFSEDSIIMIELKELLEWDENIEDG